MSEKFSVARILQLKSSELTCDTITSLWILTAVRGHISDRSSGRVIL